MTPCDNHPDREATRFLGNDSPRGDGSIGFKVSKRLCEECFVEHKKKNVVVERT